MICPSCNLELSDSEFTKIVFATRTYSGDCNACLDKSMQWASIVEAIGKIEFSEQV